MFKLIRISSNWLQEVVRGREKSAVEAKGALALFVGLLAVSASAHIVSVSASVACPCAQKSQLHSLRAAKRLLALPASPHSHLPACSASLPALSLFLSCLFLSLSISQTFCLKAAIVLHVPVSHIWGAFFSWIDFLPFHIWGTFLSHGLPRLAEFEKNIVPKNQIDRKF